MRRLHYHRVDVFTDRAFGGNPLAVVTNGRGVLEETMQSVAKEFNLSETTFVLPPDDPTVAGASAEDLLPAIVFSLSRAAVRETAVGGRLVVDSSRHAAQEEIVSRFAALQRRLWGAS